MSVAIITGAAGLIGSEAATHFASLGYTVVGVDNDMRRSSSATRPPRRGTASARAHARREVPAQRHGHPRCRARWTRCSRSTARDIALVIHTAAQPSHDWAAREPFTDFDVNANGTLNLLEATRNHAPKAAFIFTSTNKVYGDTPNRLPLRGAGDALGDRRVARRTGEGDRGGHVDRPDAAQPLRRLQGRGGRDGAGVRALFRHADGLLSRRLPDRAASLGHEAARISRLSHEVHGDAARRTPCSATAASRCATTSTARISWTRSRHFFRAPRVGEVYNMGGGRFSNCSMLEAIEMCEEIAGEQMSWTYSETNRIGDHIWWISDTSALREALPRLAHSVRRARDTAGHSGSQP